MKQLSLQKVQVEWGNKYSIRVKAIAPGPIQRTDGAEKLMLSERMVERRRQSVAKDSVPQKKSPDSRISCYRTKQPILTKKSSQWTEAVVESLTDLIEG